MAEKLTKTMARALSVVGREHTVSDACMTACFGFHGNTIAALARSGLIDCVTSNPTAAQAWRITAAGRLALTGGRE